MSKAVIEALTAEFGDRIVETNDFRGDDEARVALADWVPVAKFLRFNPACRMDHLVDLTAIDWPEREPEAERFDVVLMLRSTEHGHRVRLRTRVADGANVPTLVDLWAGTNWAEREVWDMFGIPFEGHPDLRRILMYEEFVGYPLRKDYPIEKTQPLVPYREVPGLAKLPPFGAEEGQPWGRIDWASRLAGTERHVSPAIAVQVGERRMISDSEIAKSENSSTSSATKAEE
ncbi:MAG: NADH-quinone oxidoreductase subunit C [Myxococcales bacterium]|nr:NADH-quinone oxidoreductase subunit C [Myxococcales bacterium]